MAAKIIGTIELPEEPPTREKRYPKKIKVAGLTIQEGRRYNCTSTNGNGDTYTTKVVDLGIRTKFLDWLSPNGAPGTPLLVWFKKFPSLDVIETKRSEYKKNEKEEMRIFDPTGRELESHKVPEAGCYATPRRLIICVGSTRDWDSFEKRILVAGPDGLEAVKPEQLSALA